MPSSKESYPTADLSDLHLGTRALDWLVTLCLGAIVALTTLRLAGVRPEVQADLLPFYALALILHGLWIAVQPAAERRLSAVPFLFLPFALWACLSVLFFSPAPWRGNYELIQIASALIFLWVGVNHLRNRRHLWVFIILVLAPAAHAVFHAYFQFFRARTALVDASLDFSLQMHADYVGRATGVFADPHSFGAYALIFLPAVLVATLVPRFPFILRLLCFYLTVIIVAAISFAQSYWAAAMVALLMAVVPFFCFERPRRSRFVAGGALACCLVIFATMYLTNPLFQRGLLQALTPEGEGIRLVLWKDALQLWWQQPFFGQGAGAYALVAGQNNPSMLPFVPVTPHNDFLLLLVQYGLIGASLFFGALVLIFRPLFRSYRTAAFSRRLRGGRGEVKMPAQKFFLSIGLCGLLGYAIASCFSFPAYVPALLLLGLCLLVLCVKHTFSRQLTLPRLPWSGALYLLMTVVAGFSLVAFAGPKLRSQGLELRAGDRLARLVAEKVPIAGDRGQVDALIYLYEDALRADPENVDAWIGLSAAICQTHYRYPGRFERTGARALAAAERARELAPEYWRGHAQVGLALALSGATEAAEEAFARAVSLAPGSSNAHYYYAAFLSRSGIDPNRALSHVNRALAIDPENTVARRLQRRLNVF